MTKTELKEKLMEAIEKVENAELLKALYNRLISAPQEGYSLNSDDISAIEEARAFYGTSEGYTDVEADREIEDAYIAKLIASGEYQNSREIITAALRLHKRFREKEIEKLRKEIDLGWDCPDSSMTMEEIIESFRKSE